MSYYFNTLLKGKSFEEAIELVTTELKKEGFGVLTEIDVKETLKNKIDVDFKKYKILGACNPHFAYKALQSEDKIGVFLPCNVIVEEHEPIDNVFGIPVFKGYHVKTKQTIYITQEDITY